MGPARKTSNGAAARGYAVRVVERAVDVLFCVADGVRTVGVSEIARRVGLDKGTVFRLLFTLQKKGLVIRDEATARYTLAPRLLTLELASVGQRNLREAARPYLLRLRDVSKETATLSVRIGAERTYIEVLESPQEVKMVPEVGRLLPLARGSAGKVLLAFADPEERPSLIRRALERGEIRDRAKFDAELLRVRERGYATSVSERAKGAASVAAPLQDRTGRVVAAIAVTAPADRFTPPIMEKLSKPLREIAAQLSLELGHLP